MDECSSLLEAKNPFVDDPPPKKRKTVGLWWTLRQSGGSRDMVVASWLFLLGAGVFTVCVAGELASDLRSLPFWMLTASGVLFCAGSAAFIRAFSGDRDAAEVLFSREEDSAHVDDEVETHGCSGCRACVARHFATELLVASWLFLAACVPVVVASACYVVHHDDRLYFWGVLAGSLAFAIASGFFVVASYPEHLTPGHVSTAAALLVDGGLDPAVARRHCGSDWLLSNWLFLILTAGWLLGATYLVLSRPNDADYRLSFLEAIIYFIASVYFVKGSYAAQAQADATFSSSSSSSSSSSAPPLEQRRPDRGAPPAARRPATAAATDGGSLVDC